jgi:hypothetical protein
MKKLIVSFLICTAVASLSTQSIYAQNTILIGEKAYSSTPLWCFKNNSEVLLYENTVSVSIAKNGEEGLLYIEVKHNGGDTRDKLEAPCILYLDDNTAITCVTKVGDDAVDNKISAIYKLTKAEIATLSKTNIKTVRYNLQYDYGKPGVKNPNPKRAYTADNGCTITIGVFPNIKTEFKKAETASDIKALFNL